jgi:SAM-dependent methyltransferase
LVRSADEPVLAVIYLATMPNAANAPGYGAVFNQVADEYDRHRPVYPDALIDQACEVAGIGPGAPVLEIGCGTGQLTRSLLARGLRVTAVEPGDQLIARARDRLQGLGDVQFVNARLEDVSLPLAHYGAVFCASAIHWVDPDISWRKAAGALVDGGTLALLSYFGLDEPRSAQDQVALRAALAEIAPGLVAAWPTYRDLNGTLAGVAARRENVSEIWAWLGSHGVGRRYAAALFRDAQVVAVPMLLEHSSQELNALLGTMSFWARLSPRQQHALAADNHALDQRLGRRIRSSTIACLVTARRASRATRSHTCSIHAETPSRRRARRAQASRSRSSN